MIGQKLKVGSLAPFRVFSAIFLLVGGLSISHSADSALGSAGVMTFGPGNTLFVGDNKRGLVHAFELPETAFNDQSGYTLGRAESFEGRTLVENLGKHLGDLMGTNPESITVNDVVVHRASKQIFLSVHRGHGPDAVPAIFRVSEGELELVNLDTAKHTSVQLSVPIDERLEFGQPLNTLAITDIDYFDGEIFVAGLSNETFSSTLRRISYPFTGAVQTSSIEIWHAVHAQYETRAPIITQDIRVIDGTPTLIAVYACTPLVRIPISELTDGAKVRGTMIGELGFGNTPIDIVSFTNPMDKQDYVLVTNTNRSAVQVSIDAIGTAEAMPSGEGVQPVFSTAGVPQFTMPLSGTLQMALIDPQWAVVLRHDPENVGNIELHTLSVPFFFDRSDHIVEMNWEDGPDPFGYKSLPPVDYN
ncbi:MAG: hypothetical protein AAF353_00665 [Pseudomonadota bacterium]